MYICVDFDGTLADDHYPHIGTEVPCAIDTLRSLMHNDGYKIILWTCRTGDFLDAAVSWCKNRRLDLYGVNYNPYQESWSEQAGVLPSPKVFATHYIDDRALGCPLIQLPNFRKPCVDWRKIRELMGLK